MEITTQLRTTEPAIPEKPVRESSRVSAAESRKLPEEGSSFAEQLVRKARSPGDDDKPVQSADAGDSDDKGQEEAAAMALASTSTVNKEETKPRITVLNEVIGRQTVKAVGDDHEGPPSAKGDPRGGEAPKADRESGPRQMAGHPGLKDEVPQVAREADAGTAVNTGAAAEGNPATRAPKSDLGSAGKEAPAVSKPVQDTGKITLDDAVPVTPAASGESAEAVARETIKAADSDRAKPVLELKGKPGVDAVRGGTTAADAVQSGAVRRTRQEKLRDEPVVREITLDLRNDSDRPAPEPVSRGENAVLPATVREPAAPAAAQVPLDNLARRLNGDLGDTIVRQARVIFSEGDKAEIRLIIRPPELGRVRIQLQMEQGHIAGRILVDNASVRQVIEQNLAALQRAFAEAGLEMGQLDVQTGDSRQNGQTANQDPGRNGRHPGAVEFDQNVRTVAEYDYGNRHINLVA